MMYIASPLTNKKKVYIYLLGIKKGNKPCFINIPLLSQKATEKLTFHISFHTY